MRWSLGATREAVAAEVTRTVVLALLREGRLSQGAAARVLGVTRHDVLDLMAAGDIPSGPVTLDEYRHEVEQADRPLVAQQVHLPISGQQMSYRGWCFASEMRPGMGALGVNGSGRRCRGRRHEGRGWAGAPRRRY